MVSQYKEFKSTGAYSFRSTASNKNTLFPSIASLLEHCETLLELKIRSEKVPTRSSSRTSSIYNSKNELQVKVDEKIAQELARKEFEEFNNEKSAVKSYTLGERREKETLSYYVSDRVN